MQSLKFVPGEGPYHPKLAFVGEAPGELEEAQGRPFVGRSGQLLNKWLGYMQMDRDQVYITNAIKVRPENNRTPTYEELFSWRKSLLDELINIQPEIIVAVGASATKALYAVNFDAFAPNRGKIACIPNLDLRVFPIYHPSYILRNPGAEKLLLADLDTLKQCLAK